MNQSTNFTAMSVQVKKAHVRAKSSFLGKILTTLLYGDKVSVIEEKEGWAKVFVQAGNISGFIHISGLTQKKIILNPGTKDVKLAASSDEFALAGKGFNMNVEGQFKADNPHLNFTQIDKMEAYQITPKQMQQFLALGKVTPKGGLV